MTIRPAHLAFAGLLLAPDVRADRAMPAPAAPNDSVTTAWQPLLDPALSRWEVWTGVPHASVRRLPAGYRRGATNAADPAIGLGDPLGLFTVQRESDGRPVLRISGEVFGGLTSRETFADYHVTLEVRWGAKRWPPRDTLKRDSGLLYHCTPPHGAFWKAWMRCLEFQIQEGDFGDLHQLAGPRARVRQRAGAWHPAGEAIEASRPVARQSNHERPSGQWTRIDLYVVGNRAVHAVNGVVVLAVDDARAADGSALAAGTLQLQSEGAECFVRDMRIRRIHRFPPAVAAAARFAS